MADKPHIQRPHIQRIDLRCVELGLCESRQKAQALIVAGEVLVDDQPVTKVGTRVKSDAVIRLRTAEPLPFVSRGGLKLQGALEHFALSVHDAIVLDVGASTGGFTDCVLQRGAKHVIAVDVGYNQLAWSLRQDSRVSCIERVNARHLQSADLVPHLRDAAYWPPTMATIDVSFISLTLVLPAIATLLGPARDIVALVKPQFEAGREHIGKGGVVRDETARQAAIDRVRGWATEAGFVVKDGIDSSLAGPKGNLEYLLWLQTPHTVQS